MPPEPLPPAISHTGHMRIHRDGMVRGTISDVFNDRIHFTATLDPGGAIVGGDFFIRGWRGGQVPFVRPPAPRDRPE